MAARRLIRFCLPPQGMMEQGAAFAVGHYRREPGRKRGKWQKRRGEQAGMSAEDFFNRWSRRKRETAPEPAAPALGPGAPAATAPDLPPTLEEVAALGDGADFSRFVQPGVDEAVRRSAMKKLFSDPHFNVMDGLDIYIDDYNKFEPLPAAMLAMLEHAKPVLDPLGHLQRQAMQMPDQSAAASAEAPVAVERTQHGALEDDAIRPSGQAADAGAAGQGDAPPDQPGASDSATTTHTDGGAFAPPDISPQNSAPRQDDDTI
jgi:hypothetical protein